MERFRRTARRLKATVPLQKIPRAPQATYLNCALEAIYYSRPRHSTIAYRNTYVPRGEREHWKITKVWVYICSRHIHWLLVLLSASNKHLGRWSHIIHYPSESSVMASPESAEGDRVDPEKKIPDLRSLKLYYQFPTSSTISELRSHSSELRPARSEP